MVFGVWKKRAETKVRLTHKAQMDLLCGSKFNGKMPHDRGLPDNF